MLIPFGYLLLASIPLVLIDLREHRLPNRITYPAIVLAISAVAFAAISGAEFSRLAIALAAATITLGLGYLLAKYLDVGMGDIKLLISTNLILAWFSPWLVLFALTLSFTLASTVSAAQLAMRKLSWRSPIAMGPYILIGFFSFAGYPLLDATAEALS